MNYFDIDDFQGVGRGSAHERDNSKCDPMLGPPPTRRNHKSPFKHPPIAEGLHHAQVALSALTRIILQHGSCVALSQ
jgi:hypothetical protein